MSDVKAAVETLVLGHLAEGPCHAYNLRSKMEASIGYLQRISDGMLYPLLKKMKSDGLIVDRIEQGRNAPDRRVYEIAGAGRRRLDELMRGPLRDSSFDDKLDFYARFSLFRTVDRDQRKRILGQRIAICGESLDGLERAAAEYPGDPYRIDLIGRTVTAIDDECRWLLEVIEAELD